MPWRDELELPSDKRDRLADRTAYSVGRLNELKSRLLSAKHMSAIPNLSIFASGSYGRLEAGEHSDIDLFFLCNGKRETYAEFNLPRIQMMSEIIDITRDMGFPKFSNDGEFLSVLFVDEILENLGGRADDYENHFTARLLLLLEARPLLGEKSYNESKQRIIESYFRDYPHHPKDFKPTFLTNDILRFWKTLCLNYENRRNELGLDRQLDEQRRRKQQIKNYKLKYSRLLTCFATIGNLSTFNESIEPADVAKLCELPPIDRLAEIAAKIPRTKDAVTKAVELYAGFIEVTARSSDELMEFFSDDSNRTKAFEDAGHFGDRMFQVLASMHMDPMRIRYLVI